MADLGDFDATTVEPSQPRGPIPAGEYRCVIVDSQFKENKKKTGEYLELTLEVIDGEHRGRRVWDRLNLKNPNPDTVAIARETLSRICIAVNKPKPRDSFALHNNPLFAKVIVKNRSDTGDPTNEVKGYRSVSGGSQPPAKSSSGPAPSSPAASEKAPWEN